MIRKARKGKQASMQHCCVFVLVLCLAATVGGVSPARAASVDGSAILRAIGTDNFETETDRFQQNYNVSVFQDFTPYFNVRLSAFYMRWDQRTEDFETDLRRFQPSIDLGYNRERVSAKLSYIARTSTGSFESQKFDADTLLANVNWRMRKGPGFTFGYRRQTNSADASVFGRDTRGDFFTFQTYYGRNWGNLRYDFSYNDLANRSSGTDIVQLRHQVMGNWMTRMVDNRLDVGVSGRVSRVDQDASISGDDPIAEPISPREGLFAIDTAPEVGPLQPEPRLIDGDTTTGIPEIEIGGANTFRNIGVDLGVTRPVTRLEIAVDAPSGSGVVWQVYQSDDNVLWQQVSGVSSFFDVDFFRYTIVFPETTNRFFKAVNVTPNAAALVSVTEVRALVERTDLSGGSEFTTSTNLYRADGFANYRASSRLSFTGNVGFNSDQNVADGFARNNFREIHARTGLNYQITRGLRYDFGVSYFDIDEGNGTSLKRTERLIGGGFNWMPRPTVDTTLRASRRDELSEGVLIQRNNSIRLGASLLLFPDLRMVVDVNLVDTEQSGTMHDRSGYNWRVTLMTRPVTRWGLDTGYVHNVLKRPGGEVILDRDEIWVRTTWNATAFLNFNGTWGVSRQAGYDTIRKVFGLSYSPGPKLTLTGNYSEFATEDTILMSTRNSTGGVGGTLTYRFNKHLALFASLRDSSTEVEGTLVTDIVTSRVELRIFF